MVSRLVQWLVDLVDLLVLLALLAPLVLQQDGCQHRHQLPVDRFWWWRLPRAVTPHRLVPLSFAPAPDVVAPTSKRLDLWGRLDRQATRVVDSSKLKRPQLAFLQAKLLRALHAVAILVLTLLPTDGRLATRVLLRPLPVILLLRLLLAVARLLQVLAAAPDHLPE